jgi:hypothetical protein
MIQSKLPDRIELDGAIELLRCNNLGLGWSASDIRIEYNPVAWRLPEQFEHLRHAWEQRSPNQRSDPKIALHDIRLNKDQTLGCRLQATEWREVRPLHEAPSLEENVAVRAAVGVYEMLLPNIFAVHVIASTIDGWILAFRRSDMSHYHPGDWSATYEEGFALEDLSGDGIFHRAARRGLAEEISADLHNLPLESFKVVSFVMERPLVNPAVVVMADLPIPRSALPVALPSDELELGSCTSIPIDWKVIGEIISSRSFKYGSRSGRWHPTSRYRMLLALARHFGEDAAAETLSIIGG